MRLSRLVLLPIFALMALYRSLSSATFEVSNTTVMPDVSEAVTFLSFTSMPTSSHSLRLRNLLREGDADRAAGERDGAPLEGRVIDEGEMIVGALEGEVEEASRGGGDSQEQVIQRVTLVIQLEESSLDERM